MGETTDARNSKSKVTRTQVLKEESTQVTKGRRGVPLEPNDRLLTLREAMQIGVSQWILNRLAERGEVRRVRRGDEGRVYYLESEIRALLNRNCEWALAA
jgi:hypothetical protein